MQYKKLTVSIIVVFLLISNWAIAGIPFFDSQGDKVPSLAPMIKKVRPGVVNIATYGSVRSKQNSLFNDPFFRFFFDQPTYPQPKKNTPMGLGSGVIVDAKKGYILTNNHVIDHADKIMVHLLDGNQYEAQLIGRDPQVDVAVIQIKAKNLTAIPLADSDKLEVGDFVVAIGNPFTLGQTVTSGIVSALGRSGLGIEGYEDFIQTDAAINQGNSGGALLNLKGELIGINTAILSKSGGNVGIGFAIPSNMAIAIMNQLVEHGEVQRGLLGVHVQDLTPELAKAFNAEDYQGGVVVQVISGSAAEKAGVQAGDVIIAIDAKVVRSAGDIRNRIGLLRVGEKVKITILREGKKKHLTAMLTNGDSLVSADGSVDGKYLHVQLAGAKLSDYSQEYRGRIISGIEVVTIKGGSSAAYSGLRKGDVIQAINRHKVKSVADIKRFKLDNRRSLLLTIRRGNSALYLIIE